MIAVKLYLVAEVCEQLHAEMSELQLNPLVVSVAAGVSWQHLSETLGNSKSVVCAMPNLPTALGKGVIGMYMPDNSKEEDIALANNVMRAIGKTVWVDDERQMPAIVATAGSAPAYFFLFMEAMEAEAIAQGLPKKIARDTVIQSALGAVSMAEQFDMSLSDLRDKVTSPKRDNRTSSENTSE